MYITEYNLSKYDVLIVGAGLTGSLIARHFGDLGKKVLILEKRNHIAGNLFDFVDENGILVQKYGPHVFHTNDETVNSLIHKFVDTKPYLTRCSVFMHGKFTPSPFNFKTIDQFYSEEEAKALKQMLLSSYPNKKQVTIVDLLASKNKSIKQYADFLFKSDYSLYTAKQWGIKPENIDPSVLKRVPVLLNYDEQYFYDKYQYMPIGGFTNFIKNILDNENIDVVLNHDFLDEFTLKEGLVFYNGYPINKKIYFCGTIDSLLKFKYGHLPYRSLYFVFKTYSKSSFQEAPITAYPEVKDYTRITEFSKMPNQVCKKTTVGFEYPVKPNNNNEPYYPILTEESEEMYKKYLIESKKFTQITICGRLGDFKYYNMDQAIKRVMDLLRD